MYYLCPDERQSLIHVSFICKAAGAQKLSLRTTVDFLWGYLFSILYMETEQWKTQNLHHFPSSSTFPSNGHQCLCSQIFLDSFKILMSAILLHNGPIALRVPKFNNDLI